MPRGGQGLSRREVGWCSQVCTDYSYDSFSTLHIMLGLTCCRLMYIPDEVGPARCRATPALNQDDDDIVAEEMAAERLQIEAD